MNPLLLLSARELARRIRARELTSRGAVEAHIAQVTRVNGALNAMVRQRFAAARAEADRADGVLAERGAGGVGPLHGVPCTIKESIGLLGMPQSAGLVARRHVLCAEDSTTVRRLRRAGAIPLGVTNISELCMWMESSNRVYGRSNNPYDHSRTVGGSSGGEGAMVGAAATPFGLGSDVGGSIRMPAFFNGVFGHKATGGLIPNTGQFPSAEGPQVRYLCTGPLARKAEDLWPLIRLLAGPDGLDEGCADMALGDPALVRLDRLRVLSVASMGFLRVAPELVAGQRRAADALAALGATVEHIELPRLRHGLGIWSAMMSAAGGPSFGQMLKQGAPFHHGRELVRFALGRSPHTLPAVGLAVLDDVVKKLPGKTDEYLAHGRALRAELEATLGPDTVLLFPSHTRPAPRHGRPLLPPVQWAFTAIWNVMEVPVTQVPLGLSAEGLPLGVQVIGRWGCDHVTVAVAQALERAMGGWVPPPVARG